MNLFEHAPDYIRSIAPYVPGKPVSELAREMGLAEADIVKLASNENPLGMSPLARRALEHALADLARYPDGNGFELKQALAQRLGVGADCIVLGNGSNDVLNFAAQALLAPGRSAVYAQHAFAVYPLATQMVGATGIEVAARDYGHDLDAMLRAIRPDTRVVFIANPNNPTGTFLSGAALEDFLSRVPADVLVVLDEAYNEYLPPDLRYDSIAWLARSANLLISRTFSKVYGLAGLRVGYALAAPAVADLLNRVRAPFNVNSLALVAARAALDDRAFLERSYQTNRDGMVQLEQGLAALGLRWIPSAANFLTVHVGDAAAVNRALLAQGVIVRPIAGYGMPSWLRVSVGLQAENARFLAALSQALGRG